MTGLNIRQYFGVEREQARKITQQNLHARCVHRLLCTAWMLLSGPAFAQVDYNAPPLFCSDFGEYDIGGIELPTNLAQDYQSFTAFGVSRIAGAFTLLGGTTASTPEGVCTQLLKPTLDRGTCDPSSTSTSKIESVATVGVSSYLKTLPSASPGGSSIYVCETTTRRTTTYCENTTLDPTIEQYTSSYRIGYCANVIPRAVIYAEVREIASPASGDITLYVSAGDKYGPSTSASRYVSNQSIQLKLMSNASGADPGRLSTYSINTGDRNLATVTYYPPAQWAKQQVISIHATCDGCMPGGIWEPAWPWAGQPWDTHRITLAGPSDIVIGFFNGVAVPRTGAQASLRRLEAEFGSEHKDIPLEYDWFYNQTACKEGEGIVGTIAAKLPCLDDVAEVFEQRSLELNGVFSDRWEVFWDILAGRHQQDNSLTGYLFNLLGNGNNVLLQWLDTTASVVLNQLVNNTLRLLTYFTDSPTAANREDHNARLWQYADDGTRMLLVAHSQGNLFVNSAYDALKKYKPEGNAKVVHVAPASPTLRGDYVLADIDLVINVIRGVSGLNSVPDVNINLPTSSADPTGHFFEVTYLDKARAAYSRTIDTITQGLDALTQ